MGFARGVVMDSSERVWRERGLLDAVLAGDERAWRTWYDEVYPGLYRYVSWRCGGRRDRADEVAQETLLTAVRRLRTFDPARGSFAVWLRGIAVNLLRNHFRRERRRECRAPRLDEHPMAGPAEEGLEQREQADRVARVLAALPERYEAALRAKYLDGQNVADIAAASGETPKAIESLLTRARQAFRAAYLEPE